MKKVSLLLVLMTSFAFLFSCQKMEGDDIPSVDSKITDTVVDNAGVLTITTTSDYDMLIENVKIYYVSADSAYFVGHASDSIIISNVLVKKGSGIETIVDTLWSLEPGATYLYTAIFRSFGQSDPILDTIKNDTIMEKPYKRVQMMYPGIPEVAADDASLKNDTIWFPGTVRSHWRALMDKDGLTKDLKFSWGTTETSFDHELVAMVTDTLCEGDHLTIIFKAGVPKRKLQDANVVWYKAYAKHAWGNGEQYSEAKSFSF